MTEPQQPLAILLCARLQSLAGRLMDAQSRLPDDPESLHDLRVALRELSSLVTPLSGHLYGADELHRLARECARPTNRLRDQEVLAEELQRKGRSEYLPVLQAQLLAGKSALARQLPAEALIQRLLSLTIYWEKYLKDTDWKKLARRLRRSRFPLRNKLAKGLENRNTDLHRLRIRIKRYRYFLEAYRSLMGDLAPTLPRALKEAQDLTGNWHDRQTWIGMASRHPQLQPLVAAWLEESLSISFKINESREKLNVIL